MVFSSTARQGAWLMRLSLLSTLAVVVGVTPSTAQLAVQGTTTVLRSGVVRGVDAAFDPSTNTYMVVGAQDSVFAVCTNASGAATSSVITIKPPNGVTSNKPFGSFPRVRYVQDLNGGAGAFMVIWQQEEVVGAPQLHSRIVSCTAGLLGTDQVVSGGSPPWTDFGASSFAYSPTSQKFLVAWKAWAGTGWRMVARLMDLNGAGVGSVVTLSTEFARDPGVAWNPSLNEFGVSFSGEAANGRDSYSVFVRMPADNPAGFARTTFNSVPGCLTTTTDLAYNPDTQRYIMTWWQGCGTATKVAEFDNAGTLMTIGLVSTTLGSYDALSLAYNPVSKTFALVGIERVADHAMGTELNSRGYRISSEIRIDSDPPPGTSYVPIRYPRVTSHATQKSWLAALNMGSFVRTASQILTTTSSNGGAPGSHPEPGACSFALNPTSGTEPAAGGTGSFTVSTASGCGWTATTTASWVRITSGASGTGSGTVVYTADVNTGVARSATITVGSQTYVVNQSGTTSCTYAITPTSGTEPATGGIGSFVVTTAAGCAWTATTTASWVHITAGASGTGSGTVSYSADAHVGPARAATITAGGQSYTVNQLGNCSYALNPTSSGPIASAGGTGSFAVTTTVGCTWTASTTASWIHITSGSGTASGSVSYSVDANTGSARTDTITLGGQSFMVTQAELALPPGCVTVTVLAKPVPPAGVSGVDGMWQSSGLTLTAGQPVTIVGSGTWSDAGIPLTADGHPTTTVTGTNAPLSGQRLLSLIGRVGPTGTPFLVGATKTFTPTASGILYFAPQDNWYTTWDNAGSLAVFVCTDASSSCSYTLNPASSGTIATGGASASFNVTTGTSCSWNASTTDAWIALTAGSGSGSGTASYTVAPNTGAARTGSIRVDDQTFTVTQAAASATSCTNVAVVAKPTPPPGVGGVETLWQTTGITVTAGQPVSVTATGTWSNAGVALTAAGSPSTTVTGTNCPLSGQPLLALIGRIGTNGAPFLIGTAKTWTPSTTGTLYLAPQDNWYTTWDNAGSLSVSVCVDASGACAFVLNPTSSSTLPASGGSASFTVTTGGSCAWTPATTASWVQITSGNGPGSGTVAFTLDVNPGAARTGTITVDNQSYRVSQAADPSATSCTTATVVAKPPIPPGVGGVDILWQTTGVTLSAGQPVTVLASGTWTNAGVSLTAAGHPTTTVTGPDAPLSGQPLLALIGRIGPTGAPFLIGATKTWTPTVSGVLYLAPQDNWYWLEDNAGSLSVSICLGTGGGGCNYSLTPTSSGTTAATGGNGTFTVSTETGCAWTASTAANWIHITDGSGPSSGTVSYAVDQNAGVARTGTITVGDQTFTIAQAADTSQVCDPFAVLARPPIPPGVGGVETLWQSSGIALAVGQAVTITAAGTWSDAGVALTAAGHPTITVVSPTNSPMSGQPLLALIGRVGLSGTPFLVGPSRNFTPTSSGVLYLAPQDYWYSTENNAGSLTVTVCR